MQEFEIGCQNWPEYARGPKTWVSFGVDGDRMRVRFDVAENEPRTVCTEDHQPVYQDSCVEMFCRVPGEEKYWNFEFNSAGVSTAACRRRRKEDVRHLTADEMAQIGRHGWKDADGWHLEVAIPLALIGITGEIPAEIEANFYKCGDLTAEPHYLSWQPIDTPTPDFHRPEFFRPLPLR